MSKRAKELLGIEEEVIEELSQEEFEYFDGLALEGFKEIKEKFIDWSFNKWIAFVEKNTNIDHVAMLGIYLNVAKGRITPEEAEKLIEKAGGGEVAAKQIRNALKKIVGKAAGAAAVTAAAALAYKLYKKGKARKAKEEESEKETEVSNENLDSDDVIEVDTVDPIEELYELDESEIDPTDDLDVIEEAMEDLEEAKTKLESLESLVETSLTTGGLTRDSIPYIQFAIESASGDYLSSTEVKFPSIESFNEEDSRVQNTAYVLEGIKDKFKEYYEKTAKFLSKWKEAVEKFWKENKNAIVRQRKHLKNLVAVIKADEARYNTMENVSDKNIELSSKVAEHLSLDSKLSESEIIGGLKELVKIIESLKAGTALGNKLISLSEQVAKDEFVDIKSFSIKEAAELIKKESSALKYKEEYIENDTGIQLSSQTLIGNKKVFVEITGFEWDEGGLRATTNTIEHTIPTGVDIFLYWDEKFNKNNKTLPVLSGKDILMFAEEALKFLDYIENDKADWKSGLDISDKYTKANLVLSEKINNLKISNKHLARKILAANIQTAGALIEPRKSLNKHALSVIQSLYVYLLESAKAHKHETSLSKEELEEILGLESIDSLMKTFGKGISDLSITILKPIAKLVAIGAKEDITKKQFSDFIGEFFKTGRIDRSMINSGIELTHEKRIEVGRLLDKIIAIPGIVRKTTAAAAVAALLYRFYKKYKAKKAKEEESEISEEDIKEITINQNIGNEDMTIETTDVELSQEEIEYFDGLALEGFKEIIDFSLENFNLNTGVSALDQLVNQCTKAISYHWHKGGSVDLDKSRVERIVKDIFLRGGEDYKVTARFPLRELGNATTATQDEILEMVDKLKKNIDDLKYTKPDLTKGFPKGAEKIAKVVDPKSVTNGISLLKKLGIGAVIAAVSALVWKWYQKKKKDKEEKEISKEELEAFVTTLTLEELEDLNLDCIATEEYEAQLEVSVEDIEWSKIKEIITPSYFSKNVRKAIKDGNIGEMADALKAENASDSIVSKAIGFVKGHKKALLAATAITTLAAGGHKLYKHLKAKKAEKEGTDKEETSTEELANEAIVEILSDYSLEELTDLFDVMIGNEEIDASLESDISVLSGKGVKFWEGKQIKGVRGSVVKSITEAFAKGGEHAKKAYTWIKDHSIDSEGAKKLFKWGTELSNTKKGLAIAGVAAAGAGLLYKAHKDAKAKKAAEAEKESESSTEE